MMRRVFISWPASTRLVANVRQFSKGWQQKDDVGSSLSVEQQIIRHILNANTVALGELLSNQLNQRQFVSGNIFRDGLKFLASCGEIDRIISIRNSMMQIRCLPVSARLSDSSWSKLLLDGYFNVGQPEKYADQLSIKLRSMSLENVDVEREVFHFMLLATRYSPPILAKFLDATGKLSEDRKNSMWRQTTIDWHQYLSLAALQWRAYVSNERFEQADAMLNCALGNDPTTQVTKKQKETWICWQFRHINSMLGLVKETDKALNDNDSDDGENQLPSGDPDPELLMDRQKARKFLQKVTKKRTNVLPELSTIEQLIQRIRTESRQKILQYFLELFRKYGIDLATRQRPIVREVYAALLEDYVNQQNWLVLQSYIEQIASLLHVVLEPQESIARNTWHRAAIEAEAKLLGLALHKAKNDVLLQLDRVVSSITDTDKVNDTDKSCVDLLVAINSRLRALLLQLDSRLKTT